MFGFSRLGARIGQADNAAETRSFRLASNRSRTEVKRQHDALIASGKRVAIWGGAGKSAAFIHQHGVDSGLPAGGGLGSGQGWHVRAERPARRSFRDALLTETVDMWWWCAQWRARDIVGEMAMIGIDVAGRRCSSSTRRLIDFRHDAHARDDEAPAAPAIGTSKRSAPGRLTRRAAAMTMPFNVLTQGRNLGRCSTTARCVHQPVVKLYGEWSARRICSARCSGRAWWWWMRGACAGAHPRRPGCGPERNRLRVRAATDRLPDAGGKRRPQQFDQRDLPAARPERAPGTVLVPPIDYAAENNFGGVGAAPRTWREAVEVTTSTICTSKRAT